MISKTELYKEIYKLIKELDITKEIIYKVRKDKLFKDLESKELIIKYLEGKL